MQAPIVLRRPVKRRMFAPGMSTVAQRLKIARERAGLSQSELARQLGITSQSVNIWESGKTRPSRDNLAALARLTNVSVHWLLLGEELQEQATTANLLASKFGGRIVRRLSMESAVARATPDSSAPELVSIFPCGSDSYYIMLEDSSNDPVYPIGTICVMDPNARPLPCKFVLASFDDKPVTGLITFETTAAGTVTIVTPLAQGWPAYRSDHGALDVVSVAIQVILKV